MFVRHSIIRGVSLNVRRRGATGAWNGNRLGGIRPGHGARPRSAFANDFRSFANKKNGSLDSGLARGHRPLRQLGPRCPSRSRGTGDSVSVTACSPPGRRQRRSPKMNEGHGPRLVRARSGMWKAAGDGCAVTRGRLAARYRLVERKKKRPRRARRYR